MRNIDWLYGICGSLGVDFNAAAREPFRMDGGAQTRASHRAKGDEEMREEKVIFKML